MKTEKNASK